GPPRGRIGPEARSAEGKSYEPEGPPRGRNGPEARSAEGSPMSGGTSSGDAGRAEREGEAAGAPVTARAIVAQAQSARGAAKGARMAIKRILIVDDSATERHMLRDLLTKAGYEVISSENGED